MAIRFEYDELGRIVESLDDHEGGTPRFVLGRTQEGVIWRFRNDVSSDLVRTVARLAAREKGIPFAPHTPSAPERLEMIARCFAPDTSSEESGGRPSRSRRLQHRISDTPVPRHEWVSHADHIVGELWMID